MKLLVKDLDILVINMDRSVDRKTHILNVLDGLCTPTFIQAVDGKEEGNEILDYIIKEKTDMEFSQPFGHSTITSKIIARKGCYLSHFKALNYASQYNLKNVLILEDDVFFDRNVNTIEVPDDYDIFYLGGFSKPKSIARVIPLQIGINPIDSFLSKYWCASAYMVKDPTKLLPYFYRHRPTTYDAFLINFIQKKNKCYHLYPPLIKQSPAIPSTIDLKCPFRHLAC
ncbi:MAG: hypothetical protein ACI9YE_000462 [Psychroserpens sp.]|jgi:hypothetical protein